MTAKFVDIKNALYLYEKQGRLSKLDSLSEEQEIYLSHITEAVPPSLYTIFSDQIDTFIQDEYRLKNLKDGDQKKHKVHRWDDLVVKLASVGGLRSILGEENMGVVAGYVVADLAELARISE